ncbi:hypothetical protein GCM10022248_00430 [Nonomuraea soli]
MSLIARALTPDATESSSSVSFASCRTRRKSRPNWLTMRRIYWLEPVAERRVRIVDRGYFCVRFCMVAPHMRDLDEDHEAHVKQGNPTCRT